MFTLGKKIREMREAEELNRTQFFQLTGIPTGTQKYYETGRIQKINSDTLLKITQHPRFQKYTMWLMTDQTAEASGQIAPTLSPDGRKNILGRPRHQKAG